MNDSEIIKAFKSLLVIESRQNGGCWFTKFSQNAKNGVVEKVPIQISRCELGKLSDLDPSLEDRLIYCNFGIF